MLQSFGIENFKSYRDAQLDLAPLTVLIGANASGKSNAIEALRLLSWVSKGNKLNAVKYAIQEGANIVRGRVSELTNERDSSFRLYCTGPFSRGSGRAGYEHFSIELSATEDDELYIVDERVLGPHYTVPLYEVVERHQNVGHDLLVAYNNFARGGIKPKVACMDQQAVFIQLESTARYSANHKTSQRVIPFVSDRLQKWLGGINFLDPHPTNMRQYGFRTDHILHQDGSNLSGVLFNICRSRSGKDEVLKFIRSLPEQDIVDISFVETPRGEVMIQLHESFGGKQDVFDASLLSDGTLRVLAVATAMLSSEKGSIVVIEEIDNGVHPSRANLLLERISAIAKQRDLRVLLSTHNPALLDALPNDSIEDVVFCYRDPTDGASRLARMADVEDSPRLLAQGSLGDLLTQGAIDRFVKSIPDKEEKRARAMEWLDSLR